MGSYLSKLKDLYNSSKGNIRLKQVVLLYSVNIAGIPIGIVTSIVVTRFLGPEIYGDYKFLTNIFMLSVSIFSLGFFQAGNRALVLNKNKVKAKELFGAELILMLGLISLMIISLLIYGVLDNNLKEKGLTEIFLYLIPFSWIFMLIRYFEVLFQADNRINLLAATRFLPKIGFLISALLIFFLLFDYAGNKHALIWFFFLSTQAIVFISVFFYIKPSYNNLKKRISEIWHFNKTFGFQVYTGSIFSHGFNFLTGILIGYFGLNNSGVGFYALALTMATPLSFIPNVIATTHYKDFSTQKHISKRLTKITLGLSTLALFSIWIIVGPFIRIFYGLEFAPVIFLTFITSTGMALHGLADFFNRFLGAHGQGKALRNGSIIVGLSLFITSITFIPLWNEEGAAVAKAFSSLVYLIIIILYYLNLKRKLKTIDSKPI